MDERDRDLLRVSFNQVQGCYERWDPSTPRGLRLPPANDIPRDSDEFDRSGRFGPVSFRRYEWEQTYTADTYRNLLLTYSGHRALPNQSRHALLDCITQLIETRYGSKITKRYLNQLRFAFRRPGG